MDILGYNHLLVLTVHISTAYSKVHAELVFGYLTEKAFCLNKYYQNIYLLSNLKGQSHEILMVILEFIKLNWYFLLGHL